MSWEIKEHTKAKHVVLKSYLVAWFPIMAFSNPKVVYIDGFAGPGRYKNGEDGSPIYALKIAKEIFEAHYEKLKSKRFVFYFIEADKKHFNSLCYEIDQLDLPENFIVFKRNNTFQDTMEELFNFLDENNNSLAPTFAFIDPFNAQGVPFEIVKKIMSYDKCEVFFNHMYSAVMRTQHINDHSDLYGTTEWRNVVHEPEKLIQLYAQQIQFEAKVKFTRSFNVRNRNNAHIFDLVYATNNITGLTKMKEAMWKGDPLGNYRFRDTTKPGQITLFEVEPDLTPLKRMLKENFHSQTVTIDAIEKYVILDTPYLLGHIKQKTLSPMLKNGEISVKRPEGSKSGFKPGTKITFPQKEHSFPF